MLPCKTKSKLKTNSTHVLGYMTQNSSLKTQNLWDLLSENLFGWVFSFCFHNSYLKILSYENENWELLLRCFKFLRNEFDRIFVNKCGAPISDLSHPCSVSLEAFLFFGFSSSFIMKVSKYIHPPFPTVLSLYFLEPLLQFQLPHSLISPTSLNLI